MKKYVADQGYTDDQVEKSIRDRIARQQKVAHKYYSLLVEDPEKFKTIAWGAWKKFVALRKKIRDKARMCLNLLNQNEAYQAFMTWKLCIFGSKKRLMKLKK